MMSIIKKSLIMCLGGVLFSLSPMIVDAASFTYEKGDITKESNVTKIPISLNISEGETINSFKLGCETDHSDVTCEVALTDLTNFIEEEGSFWYHNTATPLEAGKHTAIELVLTNNENSKISDVEVYTTGGSINNVTQPEIRFSTSVNAKPEVKVESSDATLKNIEVSKGVLSPAFSTDVTEYTVYQIKDTIQKVKITPTCTVENTCDFELSGGKSKTGSEIFLNLGENRVLVDVTSEDGKNTTTYVLNIIRGETSFNSAKLSELTFDDYELNPTFSKDVTKYSLTVPNAVTTLSQIIKYSPEDNNAKEKIELKGTDDLKVGENKLTLTVTNVNEDETITYEVVVTRLSEENIDILIYINNEITFKDADGIQSTLKVEEFQKLYPNEYQKIVNKEYKFDEEGNKIIEGLKDTETKDDKKEKEKKDNSKIIIIAVLIVIGLIVIIVSGILIFRKKKPTEIDNKNIKKEDNKETLEDSEDGIEEEVIGKGFSKDIEATVDIDEALNDLMNTKQYEFQDEIKEKLKDEE